MKLATRAFSFFVLLFAILAAANARLVPSHTKTSTAPPVQTTPAGQCNTGPIQCCNSVEPASSGGLVATLLSLLGIVLDDINVDVGLTCSPITAVGLAGGGCNASPVCCENNNFNGLIAIGCVPINIGL